MVGHHNARYENFGWAAARLDDVANLVPSRLSGQLAVALAPAVGGSRAAARRVLARDGHQHPSPNAGRCEAAFAGALGIRLGGLNRYGSVVEKRAELGDGRAPVVADIDRAARLSRLVGVAAAAIAVAIAGAVAVAAGAVGVAAGAVGVAAAAIGRKHPVSIAQVRFGGRKPNLGDENVINSGRRGPR
jgi:adenosylcobinamide-phosphate synthase